MINFDILESISDNVSEYDKRLNALKQLHLETENIERTIGECLENIENKCSSFVIYGEPQCGKTEFMIALSAKLIDINYKTLKLQ